MGQENDNRKQGFKRYSLTTNRTSCLRVIPFDRLIKTEHTVRIENMSVGGVGVASNERIEQGLVCFEEQVGGHKFGIVCWCKKNNDGFRAGINFVTLPKEKEIYLLERVTQSSLAQELHDPEKVIAYLLDTIKREINQ